MKLLLAGKSTGNKQEQYFINDNRCIAVEKTIYNTTADNCRNAAKHQYPQFSADIHLLSPIGSVWVSVLDNYTEHQLFILTNNYRTSKEKNDYRSTIMAIPMPPPMHMVNRPLW